ncbi:helix-turn-helix domain-containing protein [Patescibacteria group bacterium]
MRKKLTNLLRLAQLKDEEITLYLFLLKFKQVTISELVEKSQLNFMMVYRTIKRLRERGMVEAVPVNNKQDIYKPLSLQSIINKIQSQQRKLKRLECGLKGLDDFLPYVDIDNTEEDLIQVREGIDAFKEEYLKLPELNCEEMLPLGDITHLWRTSKLSYDCPEERNFIHKRLKKGLSVRMLTTPCENGRALLARDGLEKRTTRLKSKLPITENMLIITKNQSSLFICDEDDPRVITIKQPDMLEMQKNQFHGLWSA